MFNLAHSALLPLLTVGAGLATSMPLLCAVGLIWPAHIGLDRAFGSGLKHADHFNHIHLGAVSCILNSMGPRAKPMVCPRNSSRRMTGRSKRSLNGRSRAIHAMEKEHDIVCHRRARRLLQSHAHPDDLRLHAGATGRRSVVPTSDGGTFAPREAKLTHLSRQPEPKTRRKRRRLSQSGAPRTDGGGAGATRRTPAASPRAASAKASNAPLE